MNRIPTDGLVSMGPRLLKHASRLLVPFERRDTR